MMWLKIIKTEQATLVNVCDEGLLGKEFREGDVRLYVSVSFYKGRLATREEVKEALVLGDILSLVGKEAVECAYEVGVAPPGSAKKINGIPHLNVYKI